MKFNNDKLIDIINETSKAIGITLLGYATIFIIVFIIIKIFNL